MHVIKVQERTTDGHNVRSGSSVVTRDPTQACPLNPPRAIVTGMWLSPRDKVRLLLREEELRELHGF